MADLFVYGLHQRHLEEAAQTGIKALIERYYDNYTDETSVYNDRGFSEALAVIMDDAMVPGELLDLVLEVEQEIAGRTGRAFTTEKGGDQ